MAASNTFTWYEASLPSQERKRRGHFSTPPQLIEHILDACGYTAEKDLSHLRVLDPACGTGNFLSSAARRLCAFGERVGLDHDTLAAVVQHNLWGFDPDPVACFLAEMQLQMTVAQQKILPYPHIHQADGLALAWQQCENIDLFLANPPYLASKNTDLSSYSPARQRGQADSYLLFLRLALQVVRPNGWIGLILPDPILARASATIERRLLLMQTTVHHLWHLSNVFTAYVGAVVIIAQKCSSRSSHQIHWKRGAWRSTTSQQQSKKTMRKEEPFARLSSERQTVSQTLLRSQPGAELRYLLSEVQGTLIDRLHTFWYQIKQPHPLSPLATLGSFVIIRRGEEMSKDSPLLSKKLTVQSLEQSAEGSCYPVLRGGVDIRLYTHAIAQYSILRTNIKKPLEWYVAPKILIVKSVGCLQAALDLHGHVVLQTLYMLRLRSDRPSWRSPTARAEVLTSFAKTCRDEDDLYFLLALLNSRLLQQYVSVLHTAYKWVQPQIEQYMLMQLPIPIIGTAMQREQIVQRARLLMEACDKLRSRVELKQQSEVYEEQEQAICSLYTAALAPELRE